MVPVDKLMAEKKSAKVVLVNPPPPTGAFVHYQNPLIGLAYMAAVLEKNGHRVTVVDCPPLNINYDRLRNEIIRLIPVLRMAYLIERDFSEFYHQAATKADGDAKIILDMLARWEAGHERLFKRMHDEAFELYAGMPWGG